MQDVCDCICISTHDRGVISVRKLRAVLCIICLSALVPLLVFARRVLPMDTQSLVAKKYDGWSGVLRLWVFEGWPCGTGSLAPWLNQCVTRFESAHPGIYIQPQYVDEDAISDFGESGILPPDMLLFPPGLLNSPEGLVPLETPDGLRTALAHCGLWQGTAYATPVAMGGYMWVWNQALTDGIPSDWRDAGIAPAVLEPQDWRRWDAALLALGAGRRDDAAAHDEDDVSASLPGLDLGLALPDDPAPSITPAPSAESKPCRLPEDYQFSEDAWRLFINGEAPALAATQREVRRLQGLSEQGRGPDWGCSPGDAPFTDQLLLLGIVEKPEAEDRQALCREFLSTLMKDECQGSLSRVGAFSVTDAASGYPGGDPLATLEAALRADDLTTPACFDSEWKYDANLIVRKWIDGEGDSIQLWRTLRDRLVKNPNIISDQWRG